MVEPSFLLSTLYLWMYFCNKVHITLKSEISDKEITQASERKREMLKYRYYKIERDR